MYIINLSMDNNPAIRSGIVFRHLFNGEACHVFFFACLCAADNQEGKFRKKKQNVFWNKWCTMKRFFGYKVTIVEL